MAKSRLDRLLEAGMKTTVPARQIDEALDKTLIGRAAAQVAPTMMIRLEQIKPSPFQSRGKVDEAHIEELMASIEQEGVLVPLLVRRASGYTVTTPKTGYSVTTSPDDSALEEYELITGHNRLEALRRLKRPYAPVIVRPLSDVEAARALTADNALHKALSDWELYKHIKMLRDTKAATSQRELAKVLACSHTKINFLEAFGNLPEAVHAVLDQKPDLMGYHLARDIKPYAESDPAVVIEAVNKLADGKLTQAGVLGWVKKQVEQPQPVYRKEVALKGARAVYTENEARIISTEIDFEKLHSLLEQHMDSLRKEGA